jgi:hypothetical protein
LWHDLSGEAIIIDPADDGDFLNEIAAKSFDSKSCRSHSWTFDHCFGLVESAICLANADYDELCDQFLLAQAKKCQTLAGFRN